ncbi:MAG TPA: zinc-ribbon domain-containing protein [Haloplasmataceae bacterium]
MTDKTITCKDCGTKFVFTVGEQEFYKEKGFEHEPVRCPACRRARKQRRQQYQNNNRQY